MPEASNVKAEVNNMKNREAVIRSILIEQLDELTELSKVLYDGTPINHDSIQAIHNQVQQFEEQLSIYKFIRLLAEDEDFNIALMDRAPEEDNDDSHTSEPIEQVKIVQMIQKIEEFEETIAEEAELEEDEPIDEPETEVVDEEVADEEKEVEDEVTEEVESIEEVVADSSVEEEADDSEVTTDKTNGDELDLNSAMAQIDSSLAERLKQGKVQDLRSAIALNQRFLFSNELFQGNMEAFNLAVNELNNLDGFDDATRLLEAQLFPRYNWNIENEIVQDFVGLVKRRYL